MGTLEIFNVKGIFFVEFIGGEYFLWNIFWWVVGGGGGGS